LTDLLIDIGNTRLKWRTQSQGQVLNEGGIALTELTQATLEQALPDHVTRLAWASVADARYGQWVGQWAAARALDAFQAQSQSQSAWGDLVNGYDQPQQMGVDRWLAMVAARATIKQAVCVVDCGSAITLDYIDSSGRHQGSYIIPGQRLMAQALIRDTAKIQIATTTASSPKPGCNTSDAVLVKTFSKPDFII